MKGCLSLNNQWGIIYLFVWDEHVPLAQGASEAGYCETYFLVVIGVALSATSLPAIHMLH